jgi:hypothetical protein
MPVPRSVALRQTQRLRGSPADSPGSDSPESPPLSSPPRATQAVRREPAGRPAPRRRAPGRCRSGEAWARCGERAARNWTAAVSRRRRDSVSRRAASARLDSSVQASCCESFTASAMPAALRFPRWVRAWIDRWCSGRCSIASYFLPGVLYVPFLLLAHVALVLGRKPENGTAPTRRPRRVQTQPRSKKASPWKLSAASHRRRTERRSACRLVGWLRTHFELRPSSTSTGYVFGSALREQGDRSHNGGSTLGVQQGPNTCL